MCKRYSLCYNFIGKLYQVKRAIDGKKESLIVLALVNGLCRCLPCAITADFYKNEFALTSNERKTNAMDIYFTFQLFLWNIIISLKKLLCLKLLISFDHAFFIRKQANFSSNNYKPKQIERTKKDDFFGLTFLQQSEEVGFTPLQ